MRRVVLVGCGHAHLEVLRRAPEFRARGAELLLIDPGLFWYSGLGSGVLGGRRGAAEAALDPARLAAACGAAHRQDRVTGLDRRSGRLLLASGETLGFDLASFNIGSGVPAATTGERLHAAKPIGSLEGVREAIAAESRRQHVLVIGGGPTGCELAGNLLHLAAAHGLTLDVTLVTADAALLAGAPSGLQRRAEGSLVSRGAAVRLGSRVEAVEDRSVRLAGGETMAFDHLIRATGLAADPLLRRLGLDATPAGLCVGATLQTLGDERIFAAGDCAAIEGQALPKLGVYGVRAGPVLARNLLATLDGRPLAAYWPQRRALTILDLADGEGLAMRGRAWASGRSMLRLKDFLDRRFLDRYRRLYE